MTLIDRNWDAVAASTVGRAHQRARRGSQDAWAVRLERDFAVAVVCDGCSGGEASEVGAGLGARFVAADLPRRLKQGTTVDDVVDLTLAALIEMLGNTARACSVDDDVAHFISSCLLFTVQAAVIGPERYVVFGVGDGLVRVNGVAIPVPAPDDGAPDCPAYRLVEGLRDHARLRVHARGSTSSLRSLVVASDGALELGAVTSTALPNGELFGGLALFERDERFVSNPSLASKRVASLGNAAPEDDCSVVVLRRRPPVIGTALGELDGGGMSCT
ncbi:MAG: protein phosphatase 2C domain-containing protein [Deltaproteobacteria bacterium]|nr:protein phosphatase 2C domain-containing protein [Deltaproteobacteria bacterium]